MKTHITIILLLFFVVNFAYGQKTINSKRSVNTNSLQKVNSISGNNRTIIPLNPQKNDNISTLNLTVLIQGFYNGSSMVSVNPIVVTVELHDATTYEGMESQIGTLTSSGIGSFTFNSVVDGVPYYIVIKSPNTVETWSTTPVSFISGVLNYDFTTSAAQAYGNNLKLVGSKYCII
ncbi:MAG: hypothetical protein P4L35_17160, partial [Ignavibacteriaceae bacterium]|nr:hypothetical protein [Ignavibacteriaceae bacterium]